MRRVPRHVAVLASLFVVSLAVPASAKTLRLAMVESAQAGLGAEVAAFAEELAANTGGGLTIEIGDLGILVPDARVFERLADGTLDMGFTTIARVAEQVPAAGLFHMPFLVESAARIEAAMDRAAPVRARLDAAIRAAGARPLIWRQTAVTHFVSRDAPVVLPEDLKGRRVRVSAKGFNAPLKAIGANPVLLTGGQQLIAYRRGDAELGMARAGSIRRHKLNTEMTDVTLSAHAADFRVLLISERVWSRLSTSEMTILKVSAAAAEGRGRAAFRQHHEAGTRWLREQSGMRVTEMTEDQRTRWRLALEPAIQSFARDSGSDGVALVEAARALR